MSSTEQLVVNLSPEVIQIARSKVATGEFSSESEVIAQALLDSVLVSHDGVDDAFLNECATRYDHARENPSHLLSIDEAFSGLTE